MTTRTVHDPFLGKDVQVSNRLTDRLRGRYAAGPTMPNGEPEFGWRQHDTPPVQHEAADRIDALEALLRVIIAEPDGCVSPGFKALAATVLAAEDIRGMKDAAATPQPSIDAVARLSRELLIELDTYWSGTSGPSLSGIMLDWRNKYRILLAPEQDG